MSGPDIVLCTFNARHAHASLGLRTLWANLGPLADRTTLIEALVTDRPVDVAEKIVATGASIVGLSVSVWNADASATLVDLLGRIRPDLTLVLGGPEVSHETDEQPIVAAADYVITGEGETAFATLCTALLAGDPPPRGVMAGGLPELHALALPYDRYSDEDLQTRYVYVEASRGCPYRCSFCLSALDRAVRPFDRRALLEALDGLIARGARHFRFIDRTFNLDEATSTEILEFFLARQHLGLFVHFEAVPDRFPAGLRAAVARFEPGVLQLEVGIQTLDAATSKRIQRPQNLPRIEDNLRFLRDETHAHVHADLIVGLPGEDEATFARGFDRLVALGPTEIQVGILKRLRGTPIVALTQSHAMVYSPHPPYEVLQTGTLSFETVQRMKRFARAWDLVANRGNFPATLPLLLGRGVEGASAYARFDALTQWMFDEVNSFYGVDLLRLCRLVHTWLCEVGGVSEEEATRAVAADYSDGGRRKMPRFLKAAPDRKRAPKKLHHRQLRHARHARPTASE